MLEVLATNINYSTRSLVEVIGYIEVLDIRQTRSGPEIRLRRVIVHRDVAGDQLFDEVLRRIAGQRLADLHGYRLRQLPEHRNQLRQLLVEWSGWAIGGNIPSKPIHPFAAQSLKGLGLRLDLCERVRNALIGSAPLVIDVK